ncbi:hypothetical protein F4859DRAFT_460807 [Xylaria cf. heliscus]|nr:hypothetical protein F4859DRAFT_460807 [Xylaria cf. heliscus]
MLILVFVLLLVKKQVLDADTHSFHLVKREPIYLNKCVLYLLISFSEGAISLATGLHESGKLSPRLSISTHEVLPFLNRVTIPTHRGRRWSSRLYCKQDTMP